MKYKAGDKVRIKTWEDMEKEFGLDSYGNINCHSLYTFSEKAEVNLKKLNTNRIVTIKEVINDYVYYMKEMGCGWSDDMIECLVEDIIPEPIYSRFEILDL